MHLALSKEGRLINQESTTTKKLFRRRPLVASLIPLTLTFAALGSTLFAQAEKEIKEITIGSDDLSRGRFHPGRVLVRFKGDDKPHVIPTPNPMAAIARYRHDDSVLYAEPDYVVNVDATTTTDTLWAQRWDMRTLYDTNTWD